MSKTTHKPAKFCDSCVNWEFVYSDGMFKWGICENMVFGDQVRVVQDEEPEAVFTNGNFGCIFHHEKELGVTKIELPKD